MNETNKWLFQYHKKPDAAVRLICFHYAAGNASWFSTWEKYCGDDTELCAVQLPQRNRRRDEDMPDTIEELVEDFISDNQKLFDIPFIIFGHSMGAMIAYETAFRLKEKYGLDPELLVVSACGAPVYPEVQFTGQSILNASDDDIKLILNDYGQIESNLLDSQDFCDYYFPIVRSDFHVCEIYSRKPCAALDCGILVLRGSFDSKVSEEDCEAWKNYTSSECVIEKFVGGHFFPEDHTKEIVDLICEGIKSRKAVKNADR